MGHNMFTPTWVTIVGFGNQLCQGYCLQFGVTCSFLCALVKTSSTTKYHSTLCTIVIRCVPKYQLYALVHNTSSFTDFVPSMILKPQYYHDVLSNSGCMDNDISHDESRTTNKILMKHWIIRSTHNVKEMKKIQGLLYTEKNDQYCVS